MGLGYSKEGQVQELYLFRKLEYMQEDFEIPEKPENRKPTDIKYLVAFIVVIVVLIPFIVYTLIHSEPRLLYGSDNCGNFCGYNNKKYDKWECTGKNYTEKQYQLVGSRVNKKMDLRERSCVKECPPDYKPFFHNCVPEDEYQISKESIQNICADVLADIKEGWWAIILSTFVSAILCYGTLCLFRYAVTFTVWFILLGTVGLFGISAILCFYAYQKMSPTLENHSERVMLLSFGITFGVIFLVLLCVITCMVKKVNVIIQLFKVASKAIFDIPSLLLVPVWSTLAIVIIFVVYFFSESFMLFSGKLTEIAPNYLEYVKNVWMMIALIYNIIVYLWIIQFLIGAQYIVIAGAVSSWFFTRNKNDLVSPVWTAFTNFTRFHLGTVAIGSLVITIITIIRVFIKSMANNERTRWFVELCLGNIEEFLKFLSKNAYIQTAMHGQPFFKSGKRAAKLLLTNACNVLSLNSVGDFVLGITQGLLIIISAVCAFFIAKMTGVEHYLTIAIASTIIGCCLACTFFVTFEATIDSIFICFCEDMILNDGMARPYFMSKGLMEFIENSKVVIPQKV